MVCGKGINDMPRGWRLENEWNKIVYQKWRDMLRRCYDEKFHKTKNGENYIGCSVCDRWLILSNFVEDVPKIDGYDEEQFLNGELVLDKDIKSGKRGEKNKQYIMIECLLTTQEENSKEANRTREYHELSKETKQKISEANKGKHHTEETKLKMSESKQGENNPMQGKFGSECPNSKQVAQYDKTTNELIKIWDSVMDVERELGIAHQNISACCKGKLKSAGGYIWRYVEDE